MQAKTVEEIRAELIELGYSYEELKGVSKSQLKQLLTEGKKAEDMLQPLSEAVVDTPQLLSPEIESNEEVPHIGDPRWTDYVLGLFEDHELENGNPKVDGLRRVAELVFGPFDSITEIHQVPCIENNGRASVAVHLAFPSRHNKVSGVADVFSGNTAKEFAVHPLATAESRAEGRALRKALRLTKVLTAEEAKNAETDEPTGLDPRIVSGMLNSLVLMCSKINVDLTKVAVKMGFDIQVPEDLTQKQGLEIANQLSKYQRNPQEIPAEVR